jgi:hypothetical protein
MASASMHQNLPMTARSAAREDLDVVHELEEEAKRGKRERRTAHFAVRQADALGWKERRQYPIVHS